jgi:hypothetical protein
MYQSVSVLCLIGLYVYSIKRIHSENALHEETAINKYCLCVLYDAVEAGIERGETVPSKIYHKYIGCTIAKFRNVKCASWRMPAD